MSDQPVWTPRPDPARARPLPPGLRPHRHPPGWLRGWVFLQHQVWVDYWGNEHEIEQMPGDYIANVIGFCEQRAERISVIVAAEIAYRALLHLLGIGTPPQLDRLAALLPPDTNPPGDGDDALLDWLHALPLLHALRQRRETTGGGEAGSG